VVSIAETSPAASNFAEHIINTRAAATATTGFEWLRTTLKRSVSRRDIFRLRNRFTPGPVFRGAWKMAHYIVMLIMPAEKPSLTIFHVANTIF